MIVLMGLAGSGKGTQAKLLVEQNGFSLISTGDLLRRFASDEVKSRMLSGHLVEDDYIYSLIEKALKQVPDLNKCLVDGTPRSIPQAEWLFDQVKKGKFTINAVLHLEIDEDIVRERLLARGRSDDTDLGIEKRFQEYHRATLPLIDYFKKREVPIYNIDANQSAEKVHADILKTLEIS